MSQQLRLDSGPKIQLVKIYDPDPQPQVEHGCVRAGAELCVQVRGREADQHRRLLALRRREVICPGIHFLTLYFIGFNYYIMFIEMFELCDIKVF